MKFLKVVILYKKPPPSSTMVARVRRSIKSRRKTRKSWRKKSATARAKLVITKRARPNFQVQSYVPRTGVTMRNSKLVKLRYYTDVQLQPAGSGQTHKDHIFRLNSLYDPDYTGVGSQPYGTDQWANFYTYYVVEAAKIQVLFTRTETGAVPMVCGIHVDKDTDLVSTVKGKMEQQGFRNIRTLAINSREKTSVCEYVNMKKFFKIRDLANHTKTAFTANPGYECFAHVFSQVADGAETPTTYGKITAQVHITYYCRLLDPIEVATS